MFERQIVPVYLAVCALSLVAWTIFAPATTPSTAAWMLAGMTALYFAGTRRDPRTRALRTVPHVPDGTKVNAVRTEPGVAEDIEDPRR